MLVGKATSGTFSTAGATGGAETVTLTINELPNSRIRVVGTGMNDWANYSSGGSQGGWSATSVGANNGVGQLQLPGGGQAHNNLQPYVVVYMWERTA